MEGSTYTPAQRREILAALAEISASEAIAHGTLARILRCSPATLSQIRSGTYGGNEDKYLRRAANWIEERKTRQVLPDPEFVQTEHARRILGVCTRAWRMPSMAKIVMPSGSGKTTALREFARTAGDNCLYIQVGEANSTRVGFLTELARGLRLGTPKTHISSHLYGPVRQRLADAYVEGRGSPFLVLVDEATTLSPASLNILRNLHDDASVRCAVVLADTARLDGELRRPGGIAGGYEQLRRRFGAVYSVDSGYEIPLADVRAVAQSIVEALGFEGRLPAPSIKYLHRLANAEGQLGNVQYRLRTVHDAAEAQGCAADYSVAQLDFVAELVGARCEMVHDCVPFGVAAAPSDQRRATA